MGNRLRGVIGLIVVLTVAAALAVPFVQSLELKSLRAEVRVMLSYMATLQQAYHTDTGRYAFFEEPYGGPLNGEEKCLRPPGAEELGFKLKGCRKAPSEGGLRYLYQALKVELPGHDQPVYLGRGTSGSDISGENYICLGTKAKDVWEIGPDRQKAIHVSDCE